MAASPFEKKPAMRYVLLCLMAGLGLSGCAPAPTTNAMPPNIVLILVDDLGFADLGCLGGEIETPNLDRLAREGLLMTQFYNNAKCTETRASLLSGLYHQQTRNFKERRHQTLAEALKARGYQTYMVGKWHLEGNPLDWGFDHFFGFLTGAIDFFTGVGFNSGENNMHTGRDLYTVPEDFYATNAFTDTALAYLHRAAGEGGPFFLYAAYNAPHFPLHALPEDIEKYRGRYMAGWDSLRSQRYARMTTQGILQPQWPLSPRDAAVPPWATLSDSMKQAQDELMAVYAAMVDRLDQNIGRMIAALEAADKLDHTLICFISDNGACPYDFNRTPDLAPGPGHTRRSYDSEWAQVGNTPFRLYKQYSHEGGISTPAIFHWPDRITPGRQSDQLAHILDLVPTFLALSGTPHADSLIPSGYLRPEGVNLSKVLEKDTAFSRPPIFWEYAGNRAVRKGNWKLVAERAKSWELYHMGQDRTELHDRLADQPAIAAELAALYDAWARRVGARDNAQGQAMPPASQPR